MDENENNQNNEVIVKKNSGLVKCLICIIVLLIIGFGVYICIDKGVFSSKDSDKKTKEKAPAKKDDKEKNISDSEIEEIIDMIDKYNLIWLGSEKHTNKDLLKADENQMYAAYLSLLSNDVITKKMIDTYFKEVYGIKLDTYKNIYCPLENDILLKYDSEKGDYVNGDDISGHGGVYTSLEDYYVVNSSVKDDIYTLDLYVLMIVGEGTYEVNYELGVEDKLDSLCESDYTYDEECAKKYFQNHIDEFKNYPLLRYQFKKVGNKFNLYAIDVVK